MTLLALLAFPGFGGAMARRVSQTLARLSAVRDELALPHLRSKQALVLELGQSELNQAGGMRGQLCALLRRKSVPIFFVFPRLDDFHGWHWCPFR